MCTGFNTNNNKVYPLESVNHILDTLPLIGKLRPIPSVNVVTSVYPLKYRSKKVLINYFIHAGNDVKKLLNSDYRTIRVGSDTVNDNTFNHSRSI